MLPPNFFSKDANFHQISKRSDWSQLNNHIDGYTTLNNTDKRLFEINY